jgi:hypothetical protein
MQRKMSTVICDNVVTKAAKPPVFPVKKHSFYTENWTFNIFSVQNSTTLSRQIARILRTFGDCSIGKAEFRTKLTADFEITLSPKSTADIPILD